MIAEAGRTIRQRLAAGDTVKGLFWAAADASLVEFVAMLEWDFVILDLEHAALGISDVEHCARACLIRGIDMLVRLPLGAGSNMSRALDAGAAGIVVPYVESAADVEEAISLAKYPPVGRRGLAPMRGADFGLRGDLGEHTARVNSETLLVVQIESVRGLQALPEIVRVAEVDIVFAGVMDLSMSLGLTGQTGHDQVRKAVNEIAEQTLAANKGFGAYGSDAASFRENRAQGATLLATALEDVIVEGSKGFFDRYEQ